jgi:hypothetical protein
MLTIALPMLFALGGCPSYEGQVSKFDAQNVGYTYAGNATNVTHVAGVWSFDFDYDGTTITAPDSAIKWAGFHDYNCTFGFAYYTDPVFVARFD